LIKGSLATHGTDVALPGLATLWESRLARRHGAVRAAREPCSIRRIEVIRNELSRPGPWAGAAQKNEGMTCGHTLGTATGEQTDDYTLFGRLARNIGLATVICLRRTCALHRVVNMLHGQKIRKRAR